MNEDVKTTMQEGDPNSNHNTNKDLDYVIETLAAGTVEEKSNLLEELRTGETSDVTLIHPLVDCLENEHSRAVKERVLMILNRLMPLSEFREADRMLRSSDPFVRNGAVEIIQKSDIPIIRFLEKLAGDRDKDVRKFVIDALSREKSEQAIEIIRAHLDDVDTNIVYTAIEYLGNFEDTGAAVKIEKILLASDNFMVICSGLEALAKIGVSGRREEILKKFMNGTEESVTTFPLLKYLGAFGGGEVFDYVSALLDKNPTMFTKEIIDAVSAVLKNNDGLALTAGLRRKLEALQETTDNSVNKYAIAKLLMKSSDSGADSSDQLEKARRMLQDRNPMMQLCAVEMLADIGETSDIEQLEEIAEHTDSDELLEAIGDAVMKIETRD